MTNRPKSPTMQDGEIQAATAAQTKSCGFCGKSDQEVKVLIQAPVGYICDECVAVCAGIIERERTGSRVEQTVYVSEHPVTLHCNTCGLVQVKSCKCPCGDGQLVAGAAPVEQNVLDSLFAVTLTCNQCGYIQAGSVQCPECDGYLIHLGGR